MNVSEKETSEAKNKFEKDHKSIEESLAAEQQARAEKEAKVTEMEATVSELVKKGVQA
jgi:hypothetical protein